MLGLRYGCVIPSELRQANVIEGPPLICGAMPVSHIFGVIVPPFAASECVMFAKMYHARVHAVNAALPRPPPVEPRDDMTAASRQTERVRCKTSRSKRESSRHSASRLTSGRSLASRRSGSEVFCDAITSSRFERRARTARCRRAKRRRNVAGSCRGRDRSPAVKETGPCVAAFLAARSGG
jgi:hypothetical protein